MTLVERFCVVIFICAVSACTRPMLVEGEGPSAQIEIYNGSTGFTQIMTFDDPQTCSGAKIIGYGLQAYEKRQHSLPAGRVITLAAGSFLPAAPGYGAWCKSIFVSTKLETGQSYLLNYSVNLDARTCSVSIFNKADGSPAPALAREGRGMIASGSMSDTPSCTPDPKLNAL